MISIHKIAGLAFCAFLPCFAVSLTCSGASDFEAIDGDSQLFGNDLKDKLSSLRLEFHNAIWPTRDQVDKRLPLSDIPVKVLENAEHWIKSILQPRWVPDNLKGNFIALRLNVPCIPPEDVDYLIGRYTLDGYQIQIMEDGSAVRILIVPLDMTPHNTSVKDYVVLMVKKFFNLPEERINEIVVNLDRYSPTDTLHYGIMDCIDKQTDALRTWWHHSYVWTDAQRVYFSVVEMDGTPKPLRSKFGHSKRF